MFKYIDKCMAVAVALLSACSMVSCSDDDNAADDEWTATYVYLQRTDYLESDVKHFAVKHSALGLSGDVSMDFSAKVQKPASHDITVKVAVEGSELLPSANYRLTDRQGNALASDMLTIKAGQLSSDTIRMTLGDMSPLESIDGSDTEVGSVKIEAVDTAEPHTLVATNPKMSQLDFSVDKGVKQNVEMGDVPEGSAEVPASSLSLTLQGTYWYGDASSLLDGTNNTYVLFYGSGEKSVTVDLGEEKTVTAIKAVWYGSYYAANNVTVEVADGDGWKEVGTTDVSGGTQTMVLLNKPRTRYLYYRINSPSNNYLYMTQLHVYATE